MDTWIIADSKNAALPLRESLRRQQLDCKASHILTTNDIHGSTGPVAGATGLVFLATGQLNSSHLELLSRVRAIVAADAKVVVVASGADQSLVLRAVRAGANDILSADASLDVELAGLIARVRLEGHRTITKGRAFTILPCHSPSDANVLAVNLATSIALLSRSCGVLDFHFRGGDLSLLLNLQPRHTLVDLLCQTEPIDEAMFRQALTAHKSGLELLAGPMSFGSLRNVALQACEQVISWAKQCWSVVIINCDDVQHAERIRALAASDDVILAARLDIASLHRTSKHVEFLASSHVPLNRVHIVLIATGQPGELPVASMKKILRVSHVHCIPDDPVATLMSINVGNPLVIEAPNSKPAIAIKKLAESMLGIPAEQVAAPSRYSAAAVKAATLLSLSALPFCKQLPTQ